MSSIFTKILEGEIPGEIIYQNETVFVIKDINPVDTTHLLIIPKKEIDTIKNLIGEQYTIIGKMCEVAVVVAKKFGISEGYELRINAGDKQEVPHIHMHLISNRELQKI